MFYAGQKVVCIADFTPVEDAWWARALGLKCPVRGEVYTVRARVQRPLAGDVAYGLLLHEIRNPDTRLIAEVDGRYVEDGERTATGEMAFESSFFRPLITTEMFVPATENA